MRTFYTKRTVMKKLIVLLILIFSASFAHAHTIWINAFESHAHGGHNAMVCLGWGHALPMDDILNSPNGRIAIERFELLDPSLKKIELLKPESKLAEPKLSNDNFDLVAADLATQKIGFKKSSAPGVYQIGAVSRATFYTQYVDKKGKTRLKLKPKDEIKDIQTVLMSVKYQAFAKSYLTVGAWSEPKPLGHGLEIIPRTDLSSLHTGDLVEVDVLFHGKPPEGMQYITANSGSFGQSDGFSLYSKVKKGKAGFRVQNAGQWAISIAIKDDVTQKGPLKDLYGKADVVSHAATLTFNVR
ncbi:MAG: DUF4198 domain-containing protein [Desulfobacterales bacterium]|nr:DUF4198 domain-containing protein [Desulfobacterales bacterium]